MARWMRAAMLLGFVSLLVGCTTMPYVTGPRPADADEWEYLVVSSKPVFGTPVKQKTASGSASVFPQEATALQAALDRLGYEGWELASVIGSYDGDQEFVLKRRKKKAQGTENTSTDSGSTSSSSTSRSS